MLGILCLLPTLSCVWLNCNKYPLHLVLYKNIDQTLVN